MSLGLEQLVRSARRSDRRRLAPGCDHFYFLRHGQTGRNAQRIFQAVDEPLSEAGLAQVARATERLAAEPIRSVACSDIRRALDTAHAVATPHALNPVVIDGLRERDFGALIGTSSASIDWACAPEGGETLDDFVARKLEGFDAALRLPAPVLVVAHGGSLYVLAASLGIDIEPEHMGNAQPLRFERVGPTWRVSPLLPLSGATGGLA